MRVAVQTHMNPNFRFVFAISNSANFFKPNQLCCHQSVGTKRCRSLRRAGTEIGNASWVSGSAQVIGTAWLSATAASGFHRSTARLLRMRSVHIKSRSSSGELQIFHNTQQMRVEQLNVTSVVFRSLSFQPFLRAQAVISRFAGLLQLALEGHLDHWSSAPHSSLALIVSR